MIGAANRPDVVNPASRRLGRFDRKFYFPPPILEAREEILQTITKWQGEEGEARAKGLSKPTKGYGGADLRVCLPFYVQEGSRLTRPLGSRHLGVVYRGRSRFRTTEAPKGVQVRGLGLNSDTIGVLLRCSVISVRSKGFCLRRQCPRVVLYGSPGMGKTFVTAVILPPGGLSSLGARPRLFVG